MTYHNYGEETKLSSLFVFLEYQVSVRYPYDEERSLHILRHSAISGQRFGLHENYVFIIEECRHPMSKDYYRFSMNSKEMSDLPFIDFNLLDTTLDDILSFHQLQGINNSVDTEDLSYILGSLVQTQCHAFKHNASDFFRTSPRYFMEFFVSLDLDPATLRKLPRSRGQFQYKKFTVAHVSSPGHQTWSVYLWSFSIFPFRYIFDMLRPNTLSVYMPKQTCVDRHYDRITVFDGPYAGILTPSGLMTHFPMIASKTCSDVTKGDFYNGSVGDLTSVWGNQFGLNASITFLYFIVPYECIGQYCSVSTFPVKRDKIETMAFLNPDRPKFTTLRFSGMTSYVKLRFVMKKYSLPNYDNKCQISGIFIFDNDLKMTLCSAMSVARFNLTMPSSGIQFGPEVTIYVKSYPQSNITFSVEYRGTACYGLVNECFNTGVPPSISSHCNLVLTRKDRVLFEVILPHNTQESCCVQITEMPSDHTYFWHDRPNCHFHVIHPVLSNFNTTLSLFPAREQCCGSGISFQDQPQPPGEFQYFKGSGQGMPLCSFPDKTVFAPSFHVKLASDFRLVKDTLQCGIIIAIHTTPTALNNACIYVHVDKYSLAHFSATQPLILIIRPLSQCVMTGVNTNRSISLRIRQSKLWALTTHVMADYMVLTEYHVSFYRTNFGRPIAAQLEWSPAFSPFSHDLYFLHEALGPSITNCSWELEMLIQEDTHLDLTESVKFFETSGVSITLSTDYASLAFNISYTRKLKKDMMRHTENSNLIHCFHQRCYTGFDSYYKNLSWQEAHDHCQSSGHHLLSINSETEWLRLARLLFYVSINTHRCTSLMIIFLGLRNQMVGITYYIITN